MKTRHNGNPLRPRAHSRRSRGHRLAKAEPLVTGIKINKILLPTGFSTRSQIALRYAKALARQFGARLVLLHVVEPAAFTADFVPQPVSARSHYENQTCN